MTQPPDPSPLRTLLANHLDLVYSAALRQTRNPHLAEDVTQTVFLLAAKKHHSIPPHHTAAWLINATRFTTLATLRAHRRRTRHEHRAATETPPMSHATPTSELIDLPTHLDAALASLPPSDRELLIRRYFQNLPIAEIAAALHLSDNTISKRLARALEKLRHHLAKHGITTPAATLTATLLSTAIRPAPKSLAAHILSNAALTPATPIGVLLMTTPTKLLTTPAAVLLFLATAVTTFALTRSHAPPMPTAPTIAAAEPASATHPASPEEKTQAIQALDQCRKEIALLQTSSFSFIIETDIDSPAQGKYHSTDASDIRRDARGWWLSTDTHSIDADAFLPSGGKPLHQKETSLVSLLNSRLLTRQTMQLVGGKPNVSALTIWPKTDANLRVQGSLEEGLLLEGYLVEDASKSLSTYFDVIQSEFTSLDTQPDKTLLLTSHGPHGLYQLTLDPAHHFLPIRLEVTKTNADLYHDRPLNTLRGRQANGLFPDAIATRTHLLINHIHIQTLPEGDVIDAAEFSEDDAFDNGETAIRHAIFRRTNTHLNPHFTEADFAVNLPDGTPVQVISRDPRTYPALEWRNGQILRTSDHQPPTEEQSTAPEK